MDNIIPKANVANFNRGRGRGLVMVEVEIVVVILIIQISKEPHETMIIKGKLHKIKIQKVINNYATNMVWLNIGYMFIVHRNS